MLMVLSICCSAPLERGTAEIAMRIGVRADRMPRGLHLAGHIGEVLQHLTDGEERRLGALGSERGENLRGEDRVRPVVEGQDHLALFQQRPRRILLAIFAAAGGVDLGNARYAELVGAVGDGGRRMPARIVGNHDGAVRRRVHRMDMVFGTRHGRGQHQSGNEQQLSHVDDPIALAEIRRPAAGARQAIKHAPTRLNPQ